MEKETFSLVSIESQRERERERGIGKSFKTSAEIDKGISKKKKKKRGYLASQNQELERKELYLSISAERKIGFCAEKKLKLRRRRQREGACEIGLGFLHKISRLFLRLKFLSW